MFKLLKRLFCKHKLIPVIVIVIIICLLGCQKPKAKTNYVIVQYIQSNYSLECSSRLVTVGIISNKSFLNWQCLDIFSAHLDNLKGIKYCMSNEMIKKLQIIGNK